MLVEMGVCVRVYVGVVEVEAVLCCDDAQLVRVKEKEVGAKLMSILEKHLETGVQMY